MFIPPGFNSFPAHQAPKSGKHDRPAMNVKIDTKEKFHAITVMDPELSATMTEDLAGCLLPYLQNDAGQADQQVKNLSYASR